MVLTLHGVRTIDYEAIRESLLTTEAVRDVYRAMIGDDSMCGFIVVLNSGYTYELTEHTDPAGLSVRFYPDPAYQPEQTVYYLRSEAMPYGEGLGLLAERYPGKAAQLKTQSGEYIITVGQYGSLAEAEAALRPWKRHREMHWDSSWPAELPMRCRRNSAAGAVRCGPCGCGAGNRSRPRPDIWGSA